jgi:PleD family two-component response regulator
MLRWLLSLNPAGRRRPLSRGRFERHVRRHLAAGRGRHGALLFIKVDWALDPSVVLAGRDIQEVLDALLRLVSRLSPEALVAIAESDALMVFLPDLTHGIDAAEAIRQAVQASIDVDNSDADRMHWRPADDDAAPPIVGVTVGAVRLDPKDELGQAIRSASDLMLRAKQEGGNRVKWDAVT